MNYEIQEQLFVIFILLISCSGEKNEPQSSRPQPRTEVIYGVEHVYNPAEPICPEKTVKFTEERTYEGTDGNGELRVYRIVNYNVDGKGNVYFYDHPERHIVAFDSTGNYIRTIGRKGPGPGEIEQAGDFDILPNGNMVVLDYRNYRTSYFDLNGEYLHSHKWKRPQYSLLAVTDSIYVSEDSRGGGETHIVTAYSHSGEDMDEFFECLQQKRSMAGGMNVPVLFSPESRIPGYKSIEVFRRELED